MQQSFFQRASPHIVHLLSVLAFLGICAWVIYQRHRPPSPLERKIASAVRLSYHVVTPTSGPRFEMAGNERMLKLVSHALIERDFEYDPRRTVSYGFKLRLVYEGDTLWEHDALLESRQSKSEKVGSLWLYENAFTSRLDTEFSDDRLLLVHLPAQVPRGSVLEMRLLGEPSSALVRVYKHLPRPELSQERKVRRLDESGGDVSIERATYAPWALLSQADKLRWVSHSFTRMAPLGEPGIDFESASIFYTGFRLPVQTLEGDEGSVLRRDQGIALNVLGPTQLRVVLTRLSSTGLPVMARSDAGHPGADELPAESVRVESVSEPALEPEPFTDTLSVPKPGGREIHELAVPAGLHSLRFFTDASGPVRVDVTGPPVSQFGSVSYLEYNDHARRLMPDERRLTVYETGPEKQPIRAGIFVPEDPRARIMRVDVRTIAVPSPASPAEPSPTSAAVLAPTGEVNYSNTVTIEYLDSAEKLIAVEEQAITSPYTPFERLERAGGYRLELSESVGLRVVTPPGTESLRVRTERPSVIRLYRFLAGAEAYQAPYDIELATSRWRYAPRDRRQWFHTAPANVSALEHANQRLVLVAQVRLDALPPVPPPPSSRRKQRGGAAAVAVAPRGRPERHRIIEPVLPARMVRALAAWPPGIATKLRVGETMKMQLSGPARPRLDYEISARDLGKRLTVALDGQDQAQFRFTTTRGYWRLPRVTSGERDVSVTTDAGSAVLWLDRPPVPASRGGPARFELARRRTVYALGTAPLEIEVHKPPGKRVNVTMVVYAREPEPNPDVTIRAVIGGGVPLRVTRRAFSQITVAERTLGLPAAADRPLAVFAEQQGRIAGYPRYINVPLGNDLATGSHRLGFSTNGLQPLWVRFYVTHQEPDTTDRALQWRFDAADVSLMDVSGEAEGDDP